MLVTSALISLLQYKDIMDACQPIKIQNQDIYQSPGAVYKVHIALYCFHPHLQSQMGGYGWTVCNILHKERWSTEGSILLSKNAHGLWLWVVHVQGLTGTSGSRAVQHPIPEVVKLHPQLVAVIRHHQKSIIRCSSFYGTTPLLSEQT